MVLFSNLFFKKKHKEKLVSIKAYAKGTYMDINQVPDMLFSSKGLGDGFAILPIQTGRIVSPVDAKVLSIFPTKHSITLKTYAGLELLIHIGIDTVYMNGVGFESFVKVGEDVKVGQVLVKYDLDLVYQKAKSAVTPLVITNMDVVENIEVKKKGNLNFLDEVVKIKLK